MLKTWHSSILFSPPIAVHYPTLLNNYFNNLLYFWFKYDFGQKYYASQVRPNQGSNSWPPDHESTVHATEMPALTTRPSVTVTVILFSISRKQHPTCGWTSCAGCRNCCFCNWSYIFCCKVFQVQARPNWAWIWWAILWESKWRKSTSTSELSITTVWELSTW